MSKQFFLKKMYMAAVLGILMVSWQGKSSPQNDISTAGVSEGPPISMIELICEVVDVLSQSDVTSQDLAEKIGGSLIATEAAKSWEIALSAPGIKLYCNVSELSASVKSVDIYFDLECNLTFQDLVNEFGTYKVVHESKTSSALFDQVKGSRIQIYAHLFFSKVLDSSPVQGVEIRLEQRTGQVCL